MSFVRAFWFEDGCYRTGDCGGGVGGVVINLAGDEVVSVVCLLRGKRTCSVDEFRPRCFDEVERGCAVSVRLVLAVILAGRVVCHVHILGSVVLSSVVRGGCVPVSCSGVRGGVGVASTSAAIAAGLGAPVRTAAM